MCWLSHWGYGAWIPAETEKIETNGMRVCVCWCVRERSVLPQLPSPVLAFKFEECSASSRLEQRSGRVVPPEIFMFLCLKSAV